MQPPVVLAQHAPDAMEKKLMFFANTLGTIGISQVIIACSDWLPEFRYLKLCTLILAAVFLLYGVSCIFRLGQQWAILKTAKFTTNLFGVEGDYLQSVFLKANLYGLCVLIISLYILPVFEHLIINNWSYSYAIKFVISIYMISVCSCIHVFLNAADQE